MKLVKTWPPTWVTLSTNPYDLISTDEENDSSVSSSNDEKRRVRSSPIRKWIIVIAAAIFFLILSTTYFSHRQSILQKTSKLPASYPNINSPEVQSHFSQTSQWNHSNPSPCGHSPETARSAGCLWSPMAFAWYPPACFDAELESEFLSLEDWQWYTTANLLPEDRLDKEAVLRGDIERAYGPSRFHQMHCAFSSRNLFRAIVERKMVDNYFLTMVHRRHCEKFLLMDLPFSVRLGAKYFDCVAL